MTTPHIPPTDIPPTDIAATANSSHSSTSSEPCQPSESSVLSSPEVSMLINDTSPPNLIGGLDHFTNFKYPKTQHILGSKLCDVGNIVPTVLTQSPLKNPPVSQGAKHMPPTSVNRNNTNNTNNTSNSNHSKNKNEYPALCELSAEGTLVVEEKMDGMGIGIFYHDAQAYVKFRGSVFSAEHCPMNLKGVFSWLRSHPGLELWLGRDILFGEWMAHKHTVFYDALPSFFIEYDLFDTQREVFMDTPSRARRIQTYNRTRGAQGLCLPLGSPLDSLSTRAYPPETKAFKESQFGDWNAPLVSAHVVHVGEVKTLSQLVALLGLKVAFGKTAHCAERFAAHHPEHVKSTLADAYPEGFYLKTERSGVVIGRYKFIRKAFIDTVVASTHWSAGASVFNVLE